MAFDHGQSIITPVNIGLLLANCSLWGPIWPWWAILLLVVVTIFLTGDHFVGMFVALAGLVVLGVTGPWIAI